MLKKVIEFVKNFDWSLKSMIKLVTLAFVGILVLAIAIAILGNVLRFVFNDDDHDRRDGVFSAPMHAMQGIANNFVYEYEDDMEYTGGLMAKSLGRGMVAQTSMLANETVNEDTEDYEKISYNAEIERYEIETVCDKLESLKPLDYVVFKNAGRSDKRCSYRFSVESEREAEVADIIRALDPKEFNISIDTREPAVSGNVFEVEILQERLDAIQVSLEQAESAYDEAISLATRKGNVEGLSTLINGKLNLIERLNNQKRSTAQQLVRIVRSGERTISETEYAHFNVQVSKKQIVDWKQIASSWRYEVNNFVTNVNQILQKLIFGLPLFILVVVKVLVYLFVVVTFARLAWSLAKRIWKWDGSIKRLLK